MKRDRLRSMISLVAAATLFLPLGASMVLAQEQPAPQPQPAPQQQPAVRSNLGPQELDNLVAPLALYPDPLLSQVLVASTYPLEVVEAYQWLQANRNLTGQALIDAAKTQNWDPSVQALVAFPDVLQRLNSDVQWTTDLGNAFLGQQADVMAAVQRLRVRARANGKLQSTPQETVATQNDNGQQAITIEPANPQVIYVPTYDPAYIWGPPVWGYYPPLFYPAYGFGWGFGIPIAGFWPGFGFGFGFGWGWGFNWFGGGLFLNAGFFNHYGYHGYGFRPGFGGHQAWAHNYARANRATGTGGYSRSYNSAANSYRGVGANRAGANSFANRGSNSFANRGANSYANRGGANSFANRGGSSYANRGYSGGSARSYSAPRSYGGQSYAGRSYSAPSRSYSAPSRSYSAPSRSYSAPSRSFSGGGGSRSFGGGGGGFHGGGGGGHAGGGRR